MCSDNQTLPLRKLIAHRMMPTLICALSLVSSVSVALGWATLEEELGPGRWGRATAEYFWITFWLVVTASAATVIGYIVLRFLAKGIAKPITSLAKHADELTVKGGTCRFPSDSGIREINQLSTSFNRLFALQEQQAQELRDLTRNILHDIRTPISHISQQAQCIYDGSCTPETAAGIIAESCDKIIGLFETHAEIARNNAFAEREQPSEQNISEIINFIVDLYTPAAEANGVKLSASMDKTPITFIGHKAKFQQLIGNIVDNAIKFTPSGGSVAVTAFKTLDNIEISVSDTGIGIDPVMAPRVFERGFRTKDAAPMPGFGLGLALAKSIVTFYCGTITCKSQLGKGTTFTIHLPV